MLAMITKNKLLPFLFIILSSTGFAQSIDQSIISQLSEDQISLAISSLESENLTKDDPTLEEDSDETLLANENQDDPNNSVDKKFGYDFFQNIPTSTSAVGDLPLPNDYKISIKDQFTVILSGSKESIFDLSVKLDGSILFPEIGSISVAGETFSDVKEKLSNIIDQSYVGVKLDLSLKNLNAKKITIVGAVKSPGSYLVNPFSTITSSLAYSGGISDMGTLRKIKLIRSNGEIFLFDLYDLLINGDRSNDLTIEAGDTILIDSAKQFVNLAGAVNRPAIYEIIDDDNLENIIGYGLGFSSDANISKVLITSLDRENQKYRRTQTSDLKTSLADVSEIRVFPFNYNISDETQVFGAVYEPGQYKISDFSNLRDLINGLDFVDTYPWLAVLESFDDKNLKRETILFNLNDVSTYNDVDLTPNSKVHFLDFKNIDLSGLEESTKKLVEEFTLIVVYKGEEFKLPMIGSFSATQIVDFLGLDIDSTNQNATYISPLDDQIISSNYSDMDLIGKKFNTLQFRSPINNLISVTVEGEVDFPGTYFLEAGSTLADLYKQIGNFKDQAFKNGVVLQRESIRDLQINAINRSKNQLTELIAMNNFNNENVDAVNLLSILDTENIDENLGRIAGDFSPEKEFARELILNDGDTIFVPKFSNIISVVGEVLNPSSFVFESGLNANDAVLFAGGFKESANQSGIYIINANGKVTKASRNIFSGRSALQPGDTVVVPKDLDRKGLDLVAPITQVLSDIAFSAAAIDSLRSN